MFLLLTVSLLIQGVKQNLCTKLVLKAEETGESSPMSFHANSNCIIQQAISNNCHALFKNTWDLLPHLSV